MQTFRVTGTIQRFGLVLGHGDIESHRYQFTLEEHPNKYFSAPATSASIAWTVPGDRVVLDCVEYEYQTYICCYMFENLVTGYNCWDNSLKEAHPRRAGGEEPLFDENVLVPGIQREADSAADQKTKDQLDAQRYRKYRAMAIAGMAEPVTTDEFDSNMDIATVPANVLVNPVLWGTLQCHETTQ